MDTLATPADIAAIIRALDLRRSGDHCLGECEHRARDRLAALPAVAALLVVR